MSDEDDAGTFYADILCERAQAARNIAADLDTITNKQARALLIAAGNAVLLGMTPTSADILKLVPKEPQSGIKERPL